MMSEIFKFYMENFVSVYYVITIFGRKRIDKQFLYFSG